MGGWFLSLSEEKSPWGNPGLCLGSCALLPGNNLNFGQTQVPDPAGNCQPGPSCCPWSIWPLFPLAAADAWQHFILVVTHVLTQARGLPVLGCSPRLTQVWASLPDATTRC